MATMGDYEMTYEFIKTLYDDVLSMLSRIVVKRPDEAYRCESTDSAKNFELYLACINGSKYFYNFSTFDLDILEKYLDPVTARMAAKKINLIPEEDRDLIVEEQSARVIETFEETNDYYRMLMGLPQMSDKRPIYVKDHPDSIDPTTPIHKLSVEQIAQLEIDGTLDKLKEENPNAGYLDFLGPNQIDLISARLAKPFEILRLGPPSSNRTREMLETEYYKARRYVMANFYNSKMFSHKAMYYPFIGVLMLAIAIRNVLVPCEADYLNFEEILNAILKSYGLLQYFENFPFTFKRRLVLALDKILSIKGTDGVLIDICELFSFDNFTANRYYLMKTHTKDIDGNIIFSGDPAEDYTLNFVKSDIRENEIDFNPEDMLNYDEVTDSDYLWQLTPEELEKTRKDEFNLMMTKYIDVEACYEVTSLTFEVCCFINLVLYSRTNLQKIRVTNHYATGGYSAIWTMLVFLLAALAKRSNFDGNIIYDPYDIAEIMRFNYGDIQDELTRVIEKYELQIDVDDALLPTYKTIALEKPIGYQDQNDMVKIYSINKDLYDSILQEMAETTDIRRYESLVQCRDILFYSAMEKASFQKTDGEAAATYYEMLQDMDPRIAEKLDEIDNIDDLNDMLLYILEKLEDTFDSPELQYLFMNTPNTYGSLVSKYLRTAINVFKASSVQLESINIMLYLGDREPVRVIDNEYTEKEIYLDDTVHVTDEIATDRTIYLEDYVYVQDKAYVSEN